MLPGFESLLLLLFFQEEIEFHDILFRFGLRKHDAVQAFCNHVAQIQFGPSRVKGIDPHKDIDALLFQHGDGIPCKDPARLLLGDGTGILKVQDDGVSCLCAGGRDHPPAVGRDEKHGSQYPIHREPPLYPFITFCSVGPICSGFSTTWTPTSLRAFIFPSAEPLPPSTMALAWENLNPVGRPLPAM